MDAPFSLLCLSQENITFRSYFESLPHELVNSLNEISPDQEWQAIICDAARVDEDILRHYLQVGVPVFVVSAEPLPVLLQKKYVTQAIRKCYVISERDENIKFALDISFAIRARQLYLEAKPPCIDDVMMDNGFVVGKSKVMQELVFSLVIVAQSDVTVLLLGESGVGKEGLARYIHQQSGRKGKFVAVNCGQLSPELADSQLFGHLKGSFSGAAANKVGAFGEAEGGTVFLDEVFELSPELQVKLLRTMQERMITPVGSSTERPIDVRIVAATNQDPQKRLDGGKLRFDFYHRFERVYHVPSLRNRAEDIPALVSFFIKKNGNRIVLDDEVMEMFQRYCWPGNVRELQNRIRDLSLFNNGQAIMKDGLPADLRKAFQQFSLSLEIEANSFEDLPTLEEVERRYVQLVLSAASGNVNKAAKQLGVSRRYFNYRGLKSFSAPMGVREAVLC